MAKKLVCDRCGFELTEKDEINQALEGQEAWEASAKARGAEPRGIYPCQNYARCGGELQWVEQKRTFLFGRNTDKRNLR